MKLQVRKLQESDWKFLPKWWADYNQQPWIDESEFRDFLPGAFQIGDYEEKRAGLGGFIVCKEDDPIAAAWLVMTNSNCAIITNIISDLSYKDEDKEKALKLLNNFVNNFAKELGYKHTIQLVENTKLVKKL